MAAHFEFLRNTALDARNFFSPERSFYRQNQFGGTVGGPIRKNKIFFFGDYQGTRSDQGIDTGLISVPSLAERSGNLSGIASSFTRRTVSGPYIANLLAQKLGYPVAANEPYYTPGCNVPAAVRFSERHYSPVGVVGAGPASVAIYPYAELRERRLLNRVRRRDHARR